MPSNIAHRIGLSATPHRHFDESGTSKLLEYFNSETKSTFVLDIGEAISLGFLCDYELYPHVVELTKFATNHATRLKRKAIINY